MNWFVHLCFFKFEQKYPVFFGSVLHVKIADFDIIRVYFTVPREYSSCGSTYTVKLKSIQGKVLTLISWTYYLAAWSVQTSFTCKNEKKPTMYLFEHCGKSITILK